MQSLKEYRDLQHDAGTRIANDYEANHAMGKIAQAQLEIRRLGRLASKELADLETWWEEQKLEQEDVIQHYSEQLKAYYTNLHGTEVACPEKICFPSGTLQWRYEPDRLEVNVSTLVGWLESQGLDEYVARSPRWMKLRKRIRVQGDVVVDKVTGEVVAGITPVRQEPVFRVAVNVDEREASS